MLDFGQRGAAEAKVLAIAVGPQLGIGLWLHVVPKATGLLPGTIRSSMTLETLLPEHAAPGWVAAIIGLLYAEFLVAMTTILDQMTGDLVRLDAIGCLMASPCVQLDAFSVGDAITFVFSMLGNVMLLTAVLEAIAAHTASSAAPTEARSIGASACMRSSQNTYSESVHDHL
ncbi:MAG: hypothetical protein IPM29_27145 [Planctomycetes bacterium]|nr:hypothetical protein [Planctomycetota bacterium]